MPYVSEWHAKVLEALWVILFILIVISFGLAGHLVATVRRNNELGQATARLHQEACNQRDLLISAIGLYKHELGFYPPDHVITESPLVVDSTTNALLYELAGTVYDGTDDTFASPHMCPVHSKVLKELFGVDSIRNSIEAPQGTARCFLDVTNMMVVASVCRISDPVGLLGVWPNWDGMPAEIHEHFSVSPWHYTSRGAVHNPGSFDLWVEVKTPQTNILICNW